VFTGPEAFQKTPEQRREKVMSSPAPSLGSHDPTHVVVPHAARTSFGGWFNPTNWLFNIVHPRVQHMDLNELFQSYFARETRPTYGDDHTSARGKRPRTTDDFDDDESFYGSNKKPKSNENHKVLERHRRDRHRVLQKEADDVTPTLIYNLAEKELPNVKEHIKNMPREEIESLESANKAAKKTGKDAQLLSAAMFSWLSGYVVLREHDARVETEDKVLRLEHELKEQYNARVEAEESLARLEYHNRYYVDEVARLRQQLEQRLSLERDSSLPAYSAQPQLLPPVASHKRPATEMDHPTTDRTGSEKRHPPMVEPMRHANPGERRGHLPPSPSPSIDECSSSFCWH